jgi:hypothetical protein
VSIKFTRTLKLSAPFIALAIVFNSWFLSFGVRTSGDWGFFLKTTADTLRRHYFSTWLSDTQFGRVLIDAGQAPTYAVYGWLSYYLHTSYAVNERLIHLWPAVIIGVIGPYFLVKYIYNDRGAAVLGSIVYSTNTYYLALLTGHLTLAVAYAFAPLVVLFYLKAINTSKISNSILCAFLFAVCGAYEPRVAYVVALLLMLLAAIHFLFVWLPQNQFTLQKFLRILVVYASPLVIFMLLNMYWIMGLAFAGGTDSTVISSSLFGNEFFSLQEALTLFHPYWTGGQIQPFFIHAIPIYFWLIPMAAIAGLLLSKRTPTLLFFSLLGLIGLVLSKQSDEPFVGLYHWLFTHVPGFNAFREASKFYLLTALSYAVLIPAIYWYVKSKYRRKSLTTAFFIGISLLFLPNLIPIANNKIGATFEPRKIPDQYVQLNKSLDKATYNRILWVPQKSRWSFLSAAHPAVSASTLLDPTLSNLKGSYAENNNATTTDEINSMLQQNYMPIILSNAAIRYIVVPMRDIANNDNFYRNYNDDPSVFAQALSNTTYLKEASVHIKGFKVYEAKIQNKSYFSTTTNLYSVSASDQLSSAVDLWQRSTNRNKDFNFVLGNNTYDFGNQIKDLFGNLTASSLKNGTIPITKPDTHRTNKYYFDSTYSEVSYVATPDEMNLTVKPLPSPMSGSSLRPQMMSARLDHTKDYLIDTGTDVEPVVKTSSSIYLGSPRQDVRLYSIQPTNLVPIPSIKNGLWQKSVDNCAPYGDTPPSITMNDGLDPILNKHVVNLTAHDHSACSGPGPISVQSNGTYVLNFKYRGSNAQFASYRLTFDTRSNTTVTKDIPVTDNSWHNYQSIINIPHGATHMTIRVIARPTNQAKEAATTSYTDLGLYQLNEETTFKTASGNLQPATAQATSSTIVNYKSYPYKNLIPNGAFDRGLWKKRVGDCDAYDNKPQLKMSLYSQPRSDRRNILQLEAKRHIACTNTDQITVQGGGTYLLQFDYQSPNAQDAGYIITLGNDKVTKITERIPISDSKWHTYTKTITLPPSTNSVTLAVFANNSDDQSGYLVNRYDNFVLQRIPDIKSRFYDVSSPTVQLMNPRGVRYQNLSSTSKQVTITGASKPFILLMSEQYHPSWQLVPEDSSGKSLMAYMPLIKQPKIPAKYHLKVNGFENAWYVQPQELCTSYPSSCTVSADGTFTMRLTAQFGAQRWFNFGLLVSTITAIACAVVLVFLTIKRYGITPSGRRNRTYVHRRNR